jgi:hypothetical protein
MHLQHPLSLKKEKNKTDKWAGGEAIGPSPAQSVFQGLRIKKMGKHWAESIFWAEMTYILGKPLWLNLNRLRRPPSPPLAGGLPAARPQHSPTTRSLSVKFRLLPSTYPCVFGYFCK